LLGRREAGASGFCSKLLQVRFERLTVAGGHLAQSLYRIWIEV
jgi:hypothetical protein